MTRIYTTAPESYDGFSTKEINPNVGILNKKPVRFVEMGDCDVNWQCTRYASGMEATFTESDWYEYQKSLTH